VVSKWRIKKNTISMYHQPKSPPLFIYTHSPPSLIGIPKDLLGTLHHLVQPGHLPPLRLALALGDEMRRHRRDGRKGHVRAVWREGHARLGRLQRQLVRPAVQHRRLDAGRHERGVVLIRAEGELLGGCHGGRARDVDFPVFFWGGGGASDGEAGVAALGRGVR
jgi:hypothetical protein